MEQVGWKDLQIIVGGWEWKEKMLEKWMFVNPEKSMHGI